MDFERLGPEHYGKLKPFFDQQSYPLCGYALSSLIAWGQCIFETGFAIIDDAALFSERRLDDPAVRHLLLPVSPAGFKAPQWLFFVFPRGVSWIFHPSLTFRHSLVLRCLEFLLLRLDPRFFVPV